MRRNLILLAERTDQSVAPKHLRVSSQIEALSDGLFKRLMNQSTLLNLYTATKQLSGH